MFRLEEIKSWPGDYWIWDQEDNHVGSVFLFCNGWHLNVTHNTPETIGPFDSVEEAATHAMQG